MSKYQWSPCGTARVEVLYPTVPTAPSAALLRITRTESDAL
jgi:hypothetical protein